MATSELNFSMIRTFFTSLGCPKVLEKHTRTRTRLHLEYSSYQNIGSRLKERKSMFFSKLTRIKPYMFKLAREKKKLKK